jgi:hypothetical protein
LFHFDGPQDRLYFHQKTESGPNQAVLCSIAMTEKHQSPVQSGKWMAWQYIFLTLALVELVIGFSAPQPETFLFPGRLLGATFFGLFLMAQMLERESALLEQNRAAIMDQHEPVWQPQSLKNSQYEVATHPVPAIARYH